MNQKRVEAALQAIAIREGVSVGKVRANIQEAIDAGLSNPDPLIQSFWSSVPCRGERPSPEEVICFLSDRASKPPDMTEHQRG